MPPFLHFADRIHPHQREINTGRAQSWHGAFLRLVDHSKQQTGKGASGIFCRPSHLPAAFAERVLCSWCFVFLVKEERKQEKGQMVHRGRNWHWKMWAGPVPTKSFGSVLPYHVRGKCTPSGCTSKSSTTAAPQMPEPCTRI